MKEPIHREKRVSKSLFRPKEPNGAAGPQGGGYKRKTHREEAIPTLKLRFGEDIIDQEVCTRGPSSEKST